MQGTEADVLVVVMKFLQWRRSEGGQSFSLVDWNNWKQEDISESGKTF